MLQSQPASQSSQAEKNFPRPRALSPSIHTMAGVRPLGATMTFAYDVMGDLVSATDAEGRVVGSAYDLRRRRIAETRNAGMETTRFGYDLAGNRTSVVRLCSKTLPDGIMEFFGYDANGNLVRCGDCSVDLPEPVAAAATPVHHRL